MKHRILFVDDEPLALQGLQRLLRNMRSEWDMTFTDSGEAALECMTKSSIDVVVSDMLMPGMNGVQLLDQVREQFPKTIRLILSGHAERDLVLQSIRCSHQFLSKPCQPEILKASILKVIGYSRFLKMDGVKTMVCQMNSLPSVPEIYAEFIEKLQMPTVSPDELASIISRDLGISAIVLKLVNSGFFGRNELVNIPEALSYIGLDTMKSLAFSTHAFSPFDSTHFFQDSLDIVWKHSLDTARAARMIAEVEKTNDKVGECAYMAGLLHDIGKFLLASHFPSQYSRAVQLARAERMELWRAERQMFGVSHAEIGACLLGLWGLPASVIDAIQFHHNPQESGSRIFTALTAVHAANALLSQHVQTVQDIPLAGIDGNYLAAAGLKERFGVWREALSESFSFSS